MSRNGKTTASFVRAGLAIACGQAVRLATPTDVYRHPSQRAFDKLFAKVCRFSLRHGRLPSRMLLTADSVRQLVAEANANMAPFGSALHESDFVEGPAQFYGIPLRVIR